MEKPVAIEPVRRRERVAKPRKQRKISFHKILTSGAKAGTHARARFVLCTSTAQPKVTGKVAVRSISRTFFAMPERIQKPGEPVPWGPKQGDGGASRSPDSSRPDTKGLRKASRRVE